MFYWRFRRLTGLGGFELADFAGLLVADVLQVVDFGVFLCKLVLKIFALGGISLLGFGLGLEIVQQAVGRVAEALDGVFGILERGIVVARIIFVVAHGLEFFRGSNSSNSAQGKTGKKT